MKEPLTIPFEIKDGEFYSVVKDDCAIGVFISNGIVDHYPNGDMFGNIGYKIHACLFNNGTAIDPILLCGPEISGHKGVEYPRSFGIRYSNEKEKIALLKKMKRKGFVWNTDKNEVEKLNRR